MFLICNKKGSSYQLTFQHWECRKLLKDENGEDITHPNGAPIEIWMCCKCQKEIGDVEFWALQFLRKVYLKCFTNYYKRG